MFLAFAKSVYCKERLSRYYLASREPAVSYLFGLFSAKPDRRKRGNSDRAASNIFSFPRVTREFYFF